MKEETRVNIAPEYLSAVSLAFMARLVTREQALDYIEANSADAIAERQRKAAKAAAERERKAKHKAAEEAAQKLNDRFERRQAWHRSLPWIKRIYYNPWDCPEEDLGA